MRRAIFTFLIGLLGISGSAINASGGDFEALQGKWRGVETANDGRVISEVGPTLTIEGHNIRMNSVTKRHYKIEIKPKEDFLILNTFEVPIRPGKTATTTDIIRLTNHEFTQKRLKDGSEIPKSFDFVPDDQTMVMKWKRVSPLAEPTLPFEKRFQGEWELVETTLSGKRNSNIHLEKMKVTIGQNNWDFTSEWETKGSFFLNGTKGQIDIKYDSSPLVRLSIYEFVDQDLLRICGPSKPNERPIEFSPGKGLFSTQTFKRVKP